jgi:hypothetical protein
MYGVKVRDIHPNLSLDNLADGVGAQQPLMRTRGKLVVSVKLSGAPSDLDYT